MRIERRPRQRYLLRGAVTAGMKGEGVKGVGGAATTGKLMQRVWAKGLGVWEAIWELGQQVLQLLWDFMPSKSCLPRPSYAPGRPSHTRCRAGQCLSICPPPLTVHTLLPSSSPLSALSLAGPRAPGAGPGTRSGRACRGGHGGVQHSAGARPPSCTLAALPRCVEGEGMEAYVTALAQIRSTSDSNLGSVQGLQTRTARDSHPRTALKDTLYRPHGIHLCTALPLQARCTGGMAPSLTWHWRGICCPMLCGTFGQAEQMRVLGIGCGLG